ncbi:DUF3592 domain-containing protein [Aeromicrobium stalagmiti]|uniref:DUF3592 domain-containing protein n=1 Tax=Aeromicrobium stalagmiti TaxID=2738988 RepID=UPI0015685BDF|nr:DUF3592 domain-containing protein [Aeromicrobium stalagmiti]NRQ49414.1 DUF3592 domain-containing protein [Aeromicrobium stalagmiti]
MGISYIPFGLVAVGGWLVWWGLRRRRQRTDLPQDWRRVVGTVLDVGDGETTAPRIEYRTPDGRRLRVPGPMTVPFTVGQEVAVLIDPTNPRRARLDVTEREAALVVKLLLVTGGILLVLGAVFAVVLV